MSGINRAGSSNFFLNWRTDDEPVTEREDDASRGASLTNSPQLPAESPPVSGRRLLRSNALSQPTREWLEATPARDHGATQPTEAMLSPQAQQAERIVQELVERGVNLTHTHEMLSNMMNNNAFVLSRHERDILLQHFPDMLRTGISNDSLLAIRQRLRQAVRQQRALAPIQSSAPARPVASSSGSSQRSLIGRFTRLMSPGQSSSSNAEKHKP